MTLFNSKRGYTLLFAVVVSSVVLSIAAFILSISRKQFILSAASRDSTTAIYAADSGIQCAVEKYYTGGGIATTSSPLAVPCNNVTQSVAWTQVGSVDKTMNFKSGSSVYSAGPFYIYLPANGTCAKLTFFSGVDSTSGFMKDYIESRGYNMGNSATLACPINNPRAVERAEYLVYY